MQQSYFHRQDVQERDATVIAQADLSGCTAMVSPCAPQEPASMVGRRSLPEAPMSDVRPRRARTVPEGSLAPVCPQTLKSYLPLVNQIVAQIARRLPANVLRDDLLAAGVFGLLDSLRRNGGNGGDTFEWYARMRIRGAVVDELRAQDWLSRRRRAAVTAAREGESGAARPTCLVSLHDLTPVEEQVHLVAEDEDPAAALEARESYRALFRAMEQLPERERQIVGMHYFDGVKLKDIGAHLGVSEPRVSQLHARALGRLKILIQRAAA
ncbi:sigma-70 family RNA polymerase sigma factor [Polyangium fumosum]|nr:sigma-70 family RNA polymerase sigma factor [Polyangium fumosum]